MYHRRQTGYIEQQIEAIALVLGRLIGLKDAGNYSVAQQEVGVAFQNLAGLGIGTVLALPESLAATSFRNGSQIDAGRAIAAAILLEEYADVAARQNLQGSVNAAQRRAVELYVECLSADETLRSSEYEARLFGLVQRIGDDDLTRSVRRRLPDVESNSRPS